MRSANLLRDTDALDSSGNWTRTNLTVTKDQPDRDGTANRYYKLLRNGSTSCSISSTIVAAGTDGIVTFSVDAKADTSSVVRLGIGRANNSWAVSPDDDRPLDGVLRRYAATAYGLTPGERVKCYVYCGATNDTATGTSAIIVGEPLANNGAKALDFVETASAQSGVPILVPQRSLTLGLNVVSYGSAAPSTGYHRKGDLVFNVDPDNGEAFAWVCTASGTPGTWVAVSTLGATPVVNPLARGDARQSRAVSGRSRAIGGTASAATFTSGDLIVVPFAVPADAPNIATISWQCTLNQTGAKARIGVWADDGTGALPANAAPLYDSGQLDCSTTGFKRVTVGASLAGQVIWIGGVTDSSGTQPTMRQTSGYYPGDNLLTSEANADSANLGGYKLAAQATGSALPSWPTSSPTPATGGAVPRFIINF